MTDTTLTIYKGRRGDAGEDGINGVSSSELNVRELDSPLTNAFLNNKLTGVNSLSLNRTSPATYQS